MDDDDDYWSLFEPKKKRQRSEPLAPTTVRDHIVVCSAPPCDHTVPDIGLERQEMDVFLAFGVPRLLLIILARIFSSIVSVIPYSCLLVFWYFGHFICIIFFRFFFRLAHLA